MINQIKITKLLLLLLVMILLPAVETKSGERVLMPEGVFFYKSASNVFGFESTWINPAGLGGFDGSGVMLMADYFDGDIAKSWGALVNGEQSAIAYRNIDNPNGADYREWVLASGLGLGKINVGGSYRNFSSGPGIYDNRHFWNIGFQLKGDYKLSSAVVLSNLNRGRINGESSEVEQRYSISYRPFDFDLTISADMLRSSTVNIGDAKMIYNMTLSPHPGLTVSGLLDSDENFNIAVRANLLEYFVGNESRFDRRGGGRGTTIYAGTTDLKQESLVPPQARRLSIDVPGVLAENPPNPLFGKKSRSFYGLVSNIYRAADDPSVKEIVIKIPHLSIGFAQAQELRDALKYFKKSGKTVVCHLAMPNNLAYFVAAVSDSILIPPVSQFNLVGLKAELTFYAGTFAKLGVEFDLVKIGAYKSAAETLTQSKSSDANKKQINRLLDDIYGQFVGGIAEGRGISADSVKKIMDNGPYTSVQALQFGLVDGLTYADEMKKGFLSSLPEISLHRYEKDTLVNDGWPAKLKIAVVIAEGEIIYSNGNTLPWQNGESATPLSLEQAFKAAEKDKSVKAIVFRVNSPGGLALASDEILHSAEKASRQKPVIVSMGNLAASGGYFISMKADKLYADAATLTGSIGIFGGKLNLAKLYEKIELGKELYTRGKFAGMASEIQPFTDEEREKQIEHLGAFYGHFKDLVSQNRQMKTDSVESLAQGQVWTGQEAVANGLIDEVGGLKQALDYAAGRSNLKDYRVVFYPKKRPLFLWPKNTLINAAASIAGFGKEKSSDGHSVLNGSESSGVFTRMLFDISIE